MSDILDHFSTVISGVETTEHADLVPEFQALYIQINQGLEQKKSEKVTTALAELEQKIQTLSLLAPAWKAWQQFQELVKQENVSIQTQVESSQQELAEIEKELVGNSGQEDEEPGFFDNIGDALSNTWSRVFDKGENVEHVIAEEKRSIGKIILSGLGILTAGIGSLSAMTGLFGKAETGADDKKESPFAWLQDTISGWKEKVKIFFGADEVLSEQPAGGPSAGGQEYMMGPVSTDVLSNPSGWISRREQDPEVQSIDIDALRGDRDAIVTRLGPVFQRMYAGTGIFPSVALAQFLHESGNMTSSLSRKGNNNFGIKYRKRSLATTTMPLKDDHYVDGELVASDFSVYPSWIAGVADHVRILRMNGRYEQHGVFAAINGLDQAQYLKDAGYATSPTYAQDLQATITARDLTRFDSLSQLPT